MSLRGFKCDHAATEAANFSDPRSFVSLPKVIQGECTEPKPHLVLYGIDKGPIRAEVFRLDRLKNAGVNRCWKCNRPVSEYPRDITDEIYDSTPRGHWDHVRNQPGRRCDDVENGRVSCANCHSERHLQTKFGQHEEIMRTPTDFS